MKIAYVVPNLKNCGPITVVRTLAKNLSGQHKILVVSVFGRQDDPKIVKELKQCGVQTLAINLSKTGLLFGGARKLSCALQNFSPDIVHSHGLQADILVAKLGGDFRKISTVHSNIAEDYSYQFNRPLAKILTAYRLGLIKKFDLSVCCSESVFQSMPHNLKNIAYVRNGLDPKTSHLSTTKKKNLCHELNVPENSTIFLYCGPLIKRKNVPELINLFVANARKQDYLIILGDGEDYQACQSLANHQVRLLGYQPDPDPYYQISNVYLSNSRSEGLAMSILDAINYDNLLLLAKMPSHVEALKMIDGVYLGEVFSGAADFSRKYRKVCQKIHQANYSKQAKYAISGARMSEEYIQLYEKEISHD